MTKPVKKTIVTEWGTFTRQSVSKDYKFVTIVAGDNEAWLREFRETERKHKQKTLADYLEKEARATDVEQTYVEKVYEKWDVTRTLWTKDQYRRWRVPLERDLANWDTDTEQMVVESRKQVAEKRGYDYQWSQAEKSAWAAAKTARKRNAVAGIWDIEKGDWLVRPV